MNGWFLLLQHFHNHLGESSLAHKLQLIILCENINVLMNFYLSTDPLCYYLEVIFCLLLLPVSYLIHFIIQYLNYYESFLQYKINTNV